LDGRYSHFFPVRRARVHGTEEKTLFAGLPRFISFYLKWRNHFHCGDPDIVINILCSAPAPPERIAVTMLKDRHGEALLHAQRWTWQKMNGPVGDFRDREAIDARGGDLFGKPGVRAGP